MPAAADSLLRSTMSQLKNLYLNNEVVKIRKEEKRIWFWLPPKLVRRVGKLKSRKSANDALFKKRQR